MGTRSGSRGGEVFRRHALVAAGHVPIIHLDQTRLKQLLGRIGCVHGRVGHAGNNREIRAVARAQRLGLLACREQTDRLRQRLLLGVLERRGEDAAERLAAGQEGIVRSLARASAAGMAADRAGHR